MKLRMFKLVEISSSGHNEARSTGRHPNYPDMALLFAHIYDFWQCLCARSPQSGAHYGI